MSIQTDFDSLIGGVSAFNLALNVAGIINNKKNVAIYIQTKTGTKGENILDGMLKGLSSLSSITGGSSFITGAGVIISAEVLENSKLTEHPLENGEVLADNKVILPTEINIKISLQAVNYKKIIENIKKYRDDRQMLIVETKFGVYKNMQIVSLPCSLNSDNISRITFDMKLKEVLNMTKLANVTENVSDSDTVNTGTTAGVETDSRVGVFK